LNGASIESQRRPETLTLPEWQRLYGFAVSSGIVTIP
jgi:hypothetical protein